MPTLSTNVLNRVRKLPKPSTAAQGLQPLFEAVSNALYAIEDQADVTRSSFFGSVRVKIENLSDPDKVEIVVSDNGIGLDELRYNAFCEVDTAFKADKGGKGVGRLFWLDAFSHIEVASAFKASNAYATRRFRFHLRDKEQVEEGAVEVATVAQTHGTEVKFVGLREESYRKHFPKRQDTFLRYFSAHFIADFLVGDCPAVNVEIDGSVTKFPEAIASLVVGKPKWGETANHPDFGILSIKGYLCREEASTGLEGSHQLHLLADGRSVEPRKIDKLLGLERFSDGAEADLVFHGCVSGPFLDQHVNEGRTAFNLREETVKELCRFCAEFVKQAFVPEQIASYSSERRKDYRKFVERHPIYGFDDEDTQLGRVPFGARNPEEFATGLVKFQIRREESRHSEIEKIIGLLEGGERLNEAFADRVAEAAEGVQQSEQLALAQHVVRRKFVLELLEKLISRVRKQTSKEDDYHLESTLHSLLVPMRVTGTDPKDFQATSHELWVVDERLTFTRSFSSDQRIAQVLKDNKSDLRPDLLVWNLGYGLGVIDGDDKSTSLDLTKPLQRIMIVEFKRPGRTDYKDMKDVIENQITRYLRQLKNGEIESFSRERVRVAKDCIFSCFVVADIVGDLEEQLIGWATTSNGEGRIRFLENEFKGSTIEVIQWPDLVNAAWSRNEAMLNAAGFKR